MVLPLGPDAQPGEVVVALGLEPDELDLRVHPGEIDREGGRFSAGAEARDSVFSALAAFLDQLNLIGIAGMAQYPNFVVGDRDFLFVQTDGPIFQKVVDAMMFINESL